MQERKVEKKKMLSKQMHYDNLFKALRRKVDTTSTNSTKPRKEISDYLKGLLNEAVDLGWDWDKGKELVEKITPEDLINKTPLKEIMMRGREEEEKNNGEKGDEGDGDGEGEGEDDDEEENWEDAEVGEVPHEEENGEEDTELSDDDEEMVVPTGRGKEPSQKKVEPKKFKPTPKKFNKTPTPKKSRVYKVLRDGKRRFDSDDDEIKNIRKKKKEDAFANKGSGSSPLSPVTPALAADAPALVANQGSGSVTPALASTAPKADAPTTPALVANQANELDNQLEAMKVLNTQLKEIESAKHELRKRIAEQQKELLNVQKKEDDTRKKLDAAVKQLSEFCKPSGSQ